MGLDMYLYGKKYIWAEYPNQEAQITEFAKNPLVADLVAAGVKPEIKEVLVAAGYWRKANQIHKWFVDNIQDGNDDCRTYDVSCEQLSELKETCQKVLMLPDIASSLLPTTEGFFFGDTGYGEYYMQELRNTVEIIEQCEKYPDTWEFQYTSSW